MLKQMILVISPNDERSKPIRECLEKAGYRVLVARLGQESLEIVRTQRPDLALLDWKLPDLSSLAVIRTIRSEEAILKLPIIMQEVNMQGEDFIRGLEAGADMCLDQPFHPGILIARVRALLRNSHL